MANNSHLHIYCEKELFERIVAYRFDAHIKTQNEAVIQLLEAGLAIKEKELRDKK